MKKSSTLLFLFIFSGMILAQSQIPKHSDKSVNISNTSNVEISKFGKSPSVTINDGDAIFTLTDFNAPCKKAFYGKAPFLVIWIDGKMLRSFKIWDLQNSDKSTFEYQIFPSINETDPNAQSVRTLKSAMKYLEPGKTHNMIIGWTAGGEQIEDIGYHGEITINTGDLSGWKNTLSKMEDKKNSDRKLPGKAFSNSVLESNMVKQMNAKTGSSKYVKGYCTSEWIIKRNEVSGEVISRSCKAILIIKKDGKCFYKNTEIEQLFAGSKYSSTINFKWFGKDLVFSCSNLK